jgi:hypothetical protein
MKFDTCFAMFPVATLVLAAACADFGSLSGAGVDAGSQADTGLPDANTATDAADPPMDAMDARSLDAAQGCQPESQGFRPPSSVSPYAPGVRQWDKGTFYLIKADDGLAATLSSSSADLPFSGIDLTDFGFTLPLSATRIGVEVAIKRRSKNETVADGTVQLVGVDVAPGATELSNESSVIPWAKAFEREIYGSKTKTWGATLTPEAVNNAKFGVRLVPEFRSDEDQASVDVLEIRVHYCK